MEGGFRDSDGRRQSTFQVKDGASLSDQLPRALTSRGTRHSMAQEINFCKFGPETGVWYVSCPMSGGTKRPRRGASVEVKNALRPEKFTPSWLNDE